MIEHIYKFSKEERSGFAYWFAHWCAFNMTALNLHMWKFKYLFHDWHKPWLMLFWRDYKKVQKFHRKHSRHHLEYRKIHGWDDWKKLDWEALVIDWECSRFTKQACPRNAREEMHHYIDNGGKYSEAVEQYVPATLFLFGL